MSHTHIPSQVIPSPLRDNLRLRLSGSPCWAPLTQLEVSGTVWLTTKHQLPRRTKTRVFLEAPNQILELGVQGKRKPQTFFGGSPRILRHTYVFGVCSSSPPERYITSLETPEIGLLCSALHPNSFGMLKLPGRFRSLETRLWSI